MAKAFSLVSWNVEHFKKEDDRVARVVDLVNAQRPDVFALYEVEGKVVFDALTRRMPGYTFHITEGEAVQEILVGVRSNMTAFFTQRLAFKSDAPVLVGLDRDEGERRTFLLERVERVKLLGS